MYAELTRLPVDSSKSKSIVSIHRPITVEIHNKQEHTVHRYEFTQNDINVSALIMIRRRTRRMGEDEKEKKKKKWAK